MKTEIILLIVIISSITLAGIIGYALNNFNIIKDEKEYFKKIFHEEINHNVKMIRKYDDIIYKKNNRIEEIMNDNKKILKVNKFLSDQNIILHSKVGNIPEKIKSEILTTEEKRIAYAKFIEILQTSK